jgi:hypothetical protein
LHALDCGVGAAHVLAAAGQNDELEFTCVVDRAASLQCFLTDFPLGQGVVFSHTFLNDIVELVIRGVHEHSILKITLEVKPCVIGSLELRPIHIPLNPIRNGTRKPFHKDMNELILINTLSDLLINVQLKSADNIVFDIGPAIGQEPEPL